MKDSFKNSLKKLSGIANQFDKESVVIKFALLTSLSKQRFSSDVTLVNYCNTLIFICSHPSNKNELVLAEKELLRMAAFLKKSGKTVKKKLAGSGLPYTEFIGAFSHDILIWVSLQKNIRLELDSFDRNGTSLNTILHLTLPHIEKNITELELTAQELFEELGIRKEYQIRFLIDQLQKFNDRPYVKDYLFDSLKLFAKLESHDTSFSKPFNRFARKSVFFHKDLIKKFEGRELMDKNVPAPKKLNAEDTQGLMAVIRNSLLLLGRETDPSTYLDPASLRLYELDRGVSIAIYGMIPKRQLPSEQYVGYTLFKNGFPAAYGGAWIYGLRALFGINIFEAFRGGESGYLLCQLLRVYRQVFHVSYVEVEPYQFGKDNPEGIESGAFWFYYRYGFLPVDKALNRLAENEAKKIRTQKGYRSSRQTLIKFTDSNVFLNFGKKVPPSPSDLSHKITTFINKTYKGNRTLAERDCARIFIEKVGGMASMSTDEYATLKEIAFTAAALKLHSVHKLNLLKLMVRAKPNDIYKYQELLIEFLEGKDEP